MYNTTPSRAALFKGKFVAFLATLVVLGITVFLARNFLLVKSVDLALQSMFPKSKTHKIVYEKAYWEGAHIVISGLHLCEDDVDVVIDQLEVDFKFTLKNLFFQPHLKLVHPQIRVISSPSSNPQSANFLGAFVPTKHVCLKVDVQSGVLQVDAQRLYFSFQSKQEREELGTLYVTHDPSLVRDSFLVAEFQVHDEKLLCDLTVQQMGLDRILQLLSAVHPHLAKEWENVQGQSQIRGKARFNFSGEIDALTCQFAIQNLALSNSSKKFVATAGNFEGHFSYPVPNSEGSLPWQKMLSQMQLDRGEFHFANAWNFLNLQGQLSLDPQKDPLLHLTGNLEASAAPLRFTLEGKGALHENESFWLELAMSFFDAKEKEAAFHLSLCRPEKQQIVIQTEFKELLGEQLDFFRTFCCGTFPELEKWTISDGNFSGKGMAWFEKSELSRFEVEHLVGEKVILKQGESILPLHSVKLNGEFTQLAPKPTGELNIDASFSFPWALHFFMPSTEARKNNELSHLVSNLKWKKGNASISGSFTAADPNDQLQFGFDCPYFFPNAWDEIQNGWVHTASLSQFLFQPILKQFSQAFELEGDLDLCGTLDDGLWQLSIQTNSLRALFPDFSIETGAIGEKDPLFLKTDGRVKLNFNVLTNSLEAKIPLKKAKIYDQKGQISLDNAKGDLLISFNDSQKKIHGKFEDASLSIADANLLTDLKFELNINGQNDEFIFEDIVGKCAIFSQSPCLFKCPAFNLKNEGSSFAAQIVSNGKELIGIQALSKNISEWKAYLKFSKEMPIQGEFETTLFSDISKNTLSLESYAENTQFWGRPVQNFAFTLKKQQNQWLIEKLSADSLQFAGKGVYENKRFNAHTFILNFKDIAMQGSGNVEFHTASETKDWAVMAELGFDFVAQSPCPMQFHVLPGMKVAFNPASGLLISDVHFKGENSECAIEYAEYLPKAEKWKIQTCRALIDPSLYNKLKVPKSLQKFELENPLKTIFNLEFEKQNLQLIGKIFQGFFWTEKKQDLLFNFERANRKGKLLVQEPSHEERMQFDLAFGEDENIFVDKINGAVCGLIAHLKRDEKKQGFLAYEGEVKVDFNQLVPFLPEAQKKTIEEWKLGPGYQFQGLFVVPPGGYKESKFFGKVTGDEFECYGLKFKKLETKAIFSAKEAHFENLVVKDEIGNLSIKKMQWNKEGEHWSFTIPVLTLQDVSPHLATKGQNKNLLIKQATMTNFAGILGDAPLFQGQGSFHFTSRNKKDFSLFDVPLEMIKNLGLDPGLLTPISGEVEFEFQQGKCVITKLKNVRSEGGRSEFYLPSAPMTSYLDLNGNVYVDLKMKQNVVLNLTEPFTLSIRGTFKEPRYSLR